MGNFPFFVLLLAAFGCSCQAAQDAGAQQRFAGTWEAKFKDKIICTIKLETGKTIFGAMHDCKINVNGEGDLIEPEASESDDKPDPILDPKIQGDTLSFEIKDGDEAQHLKFELKVTSGGQAELRFVSAPMPIKPIHFEKK